MRCLVLILLAGAAGAANPLLLEERAWKGVIEVESVSISPPFGSGRETQTERLEFVLITKPPRRSLGTPRLPFAMRESSGRYELSLRLAEGEGEDEVRTKGLGRGRLHTRVVGFVEPETRRYRLQVRTEPDRIVARTVMTGLWKGRPATWRSVAARRSFLARFEAEGRAGEGAAAIAGKREFVDRKERLRRDVRITWRIERIDPVVAGRVTDQRGRPVPGLQVVATNTNPGRVQKRLPPLRREGVTDADGRFSVPVFWAHWNVQVKGAARDGLVFEGLRLEEGAQVRFDGVPFLDVKVNAYRERALPDSHLLRRHFQGDVDRYMQHVKERASKRRLQLALAD